MITTLQTPPSPTAQTHKHTICLSASINCEELVNDNFDDADDNINNNNNNNITTTKKKKRRRGRMHFSCRLNSGHLGPLLKKEKKKAFSQFKLFNKMS